MSPAERERIAAQVRASRQRQGLPSYVQDPSVLDRLAGRLLECAAERTAPTWASDDDRATPARQGSRQVLAGSANGSHGHGR